MPEQFAPHFALHCNDCHTDLSRDAFNLEGRCPVCGNGTVVEIEAKETPPTAIDPGYYGVDGKLKWGYPIDVGHLIAQLQTLDPKMKVSSVMHINGKARAYGLSLSYERWDESGWLDFTLDVPKCLAIWAYAPEQ